MTDGESSVDPGVEDVRSPPAKRREIESPVAEDAGAPRQARPRLVIKEMVLENFKSYGGTQRIGPFHHCFSSVVGPNGSGKFSAIAVPGFDRHINATSRDCTERERATSSTRYASFSA